MHAGGTVSNDDAVGTARPAPRPTVSIGLPVYNGEPYLSAALDALLVQTFTDFELIIFDNASTDRTQEICLEYAARDARVRYFRNQRTVGAADNGNRTFRFARGRYFRWAADDDLVAPTLLERCVEVLESDPGVVLCHTQVAHIDESDEVFDIVVRARDPELQPWQLFSDVIKPDDACEETYGLVRHDALAATGLERNYTDSDRTMLAHLALLGGYHEVPEVLFSKRFHPAMSTELHPDWRDRMRFYGEQYAEKITLPTWSQFVHYLRMIIVTPIGLRQRITCFAIMVRWVGTYRKWRGLAKDLLLALQRLAIRAVRRPEDALGVDPNDTDDADDTDDAMLLPVGVSDEPTLTTWPDAPTVGVVVPNYNKAPFVEETIRSVLAQTYPTIDLVVVDDGSTDDSVGRIQRLLQDTDARLVTLENGGVSRARNAGFGALGRDATYVMFLDADDVLEPHALDTLVSYMEANADVAATHGIATLIDDQGAVLGREPYLHRWEPFGPGRRRLPDDEPATSLASVYARFQLLPSATLIRRSAFEQTDGWDSSLCRPARPFHAEDKDMATQLALVGDVHRLYEPLFRYRILPTPHRSTLYEGLKELDRKWWHASLPRSDRSRVRRAVRFNARVAMLDVGAAWWDAVRGGGSASRLEATQNFVASVARWLTLPVRLYRAGPPGS